MCPNEACDSLTSPVFATVSALEASFLGSRSSKYHEWVIKVLCHISTTPHKKQKITLKKKKDYKDYIISSLNVKPFLL